MGDESPGCNSVHDENRRRLERSAGIWDASIMRRLLLLTACLLGVTVPAAAAPTTILAGPWGSYQKGYGHSRPTTIFNGGDPTGLVTGIHWKTWGKAHAIGTGKAYYVGRGQAVYQATLQRARIVLFHRGTCHGRRAYNAITWYFPGHGQHFNARRYINPCTGSYHGL